jgi:hypothetical protein
MAAGSTYTPIATVTASGVSSFLVMSSIPSTYTDLVLIGSAIKLAIQSTRMTFNSDTATNYSDTYITGTGSAATSTRGSNTGWIYLNDSSSSTTNPNTFIANIMNYADTATYKTVVSRYSAADAAVEASVHVWRSTSAINRIDISTSSGTFSAGTTFTLYGIASA